MIKAFLAKSWNLSWVTSHCRRLHVTQLPAVSHKYCKNCKLPPPLAMTSLSNSWVIAAMNLKSRDRTMGQRDKKTRGHSYQLVLSQLQTKWLLSTSTFAPGLFKRLNEGIAIALNGKIGSQANLFSRKMRPNPWESTLSSCKKEVTQFRHCKKWHHNNLQCVSDRMLTIIACKLFFRHPVIGFRILKTLIDLQYQPLVWDPQMVFQSIFQKCCLEYQPNHKSH